MLDAQHVPNRADSPPTADYVIRSTRLLTTGEPLLSFAVDHPAGSLPPSLPSGPVTGTADMEFTDIFVKLQPCWPRMHHLFALLCLVAVVYKMTILFAKQRDAIRNFAAFPSPPSHWLFGHVFEVMQSLWRPATKQRVNTSLHSVVRMKCRNVTTYLQLYKGFNTPLNVFIELFITFIGQ